jgi:predicted outer membrane repeat protein
MRSAFWQGPVTISSFIILPLVLLPAPALARTWHVPSEAPTIQAGIDSATAGDVVEVAGGKYNEYLLQMKPNVILRSETGLADCATIDAQRQANHIQCDQIGEGATIEGFTFINGWGGNRGGAISCDGSSPRIQHCDFDSNTAYYGGAIFCLNQSSPWIVDCNFRNNWATGDGAISISYSAVTLGNCTFSENSAFEGAGAIWCSNGGSLTATGCEFHRNTTFEEGGAISCHDNGALDLTDCLFEENSTEAPGGAIQFSGSGTLKGCTFRGNTSPKGGAVACWDYGCMISDCVFTDNAAEGYGGAIYCSPGYSSPGIAPIITGCTITGNSAQLYGAGISVHRGITAQVENTIIAFAARGGAVYCDGISSIALTCSDVYGNEGGDWVGCLAGQEGGSGNLAADPLFCMAGDGDFRLDAASPCLSANNSCQVRIGALGVGCGTTSAPPAFLADRVRLSPNHPNPFNPRTTIPYFLPADGTIRLTIHDAAGHLVASLTDEIRPRGEHTAVWDGRDNRGRAVASGTYLVRLEAAGRQQTRKMMLLR